MSLKHFWFLLLLGAIIFSFIGCLQNTAYFLEITAFSIKQAFISTMLINIMGVSLAFVFFRRHHKKSVRLMCRILPITLVIPSLITVLMIAISFGADSYMGKTLITLFNFKLYGLNGIVLCHLFFYVPYASSQYQAYFRSIPAQYWKFSELLGWNSIQQWLWILTPALKHGAIKYVCIIFCLCLSSFTIVMCFGGGPQATTYSLAIYQNLAFSEQFKEALWLITFTTTLNLTCFSLLKYFKNPVSSNRFKTHTMPTIHIWNLPYHRYCDYCILLLAALFFTTPLVLYCFESWHHLKTASIESDLIESLISSTLCGIGTVILVLFITIAGATITFKYRPKILEFIIIGHDLLFAIPGFALTALVFMAFWYSLDIWWTSYLMMIVSNALLAFPILFFKVRTKLLNEHSRYYKTAHILNLSSIKIIRYVVLPILSLELGQLSALSFLMALGDLRASIFASTTDILLLPTYIYHCIARYQLNEAYVSTLILLGIIFVFFILSERIFNRAKTHA